MKPVTNKAKIKALKAARVQVEEGHTSYICIALLLGSQRYKCSYETYDYLRRYIMKSLEGHDTLSDFIDAVVGLEISTQLGRNDYKQARLQYIDWMIASLEEDIASGIK